MTSTSGLRGNRLMELLLASRGLIIALVSISTAEAASVVSSVPSTSPTLTVQGPFNGNDGFGRKAALSNGIGIFGQDFGDGTTPRTGVASLVDVATGQVLETLAPPDGASGDRFGISVDISANTAIVGAWLHSPEGIGSAGAAYLYDVTDPTAAVFQHKLVASDARPLAQFSTVAIDANVAIVGASENDESPFSAGSAYLFDVSLGTETAKLYPSDGQLGDKFGQSVDVQGNYAVVGSRQGAYLFDVSSGQELAKIKSPSVQADDGFGGTVAIDGDRLVIGALGDDQLGNSAGLAYLFDISDVTTPSPVATLFAPDLGDVALFGSAVDIDGPLAIVGARGDRRFSNPAGAAYVFDADSGALLTRALPGDIAPGSRFGISVAVDGDTLLVGSDIGNEATMTPGEVYVYNFPIPEPTTASAAACLLCCLSFGRLGRPSL